MLLKVKTRTVDGRTCLQIHEVGGKSHLTKAPFPPYYYAPYEVPFGNKTEVCKRLLSTLQEKTLWRVGFPNTYALKESRVTGGIEDDVPYDQRVAIDKGFKHASPPLRHEAFDLEMETRAGLFPDANIDRITAISYVGDGFKECKTLHDVSERELIQWFLNTVRDRNPDALDSFFGSFADWEWLVKRAQKNGLRLSVGRDGSEPYMIKRTFRSGKKIGEDVIVDITGRVHFDVWKEVNADQTLFGIKNKQLKTVAKWFGIPVIEVDRSAMANLSADELRDYCLSDANATFELAKIYIRNLVPLGEYLEIPFNMVVDRSPSHPSNYIYLRRLGRLGIVADKKNSERYPEFVAEGRKAYQGALINLFHAGVFYDVKKLDFKSMYPSILYCFNYSPETIFDVHIHSGETLPRWVDIKNNKISVYDKYLGIITVKVRLDSDGVTRQVLKEFMQWRQRIRDDAKAHPDRATEINSQQWAVKVLMNAMNGYHGMQWASCGCFPISAHVDGHGRLWIDESTDFLTAQGALNIERDTDGIYYQGEDYAPQVTELIRGIIPEQFDRSVVKVDSETFKAGIFYEEKGYVLLKNDGKLVFHGSGLKGRHLPKLCDNALERVAVAIFQKENVIDVLNDFARTVKDRPQSDFVMTAELKKRPEEYNKKSQYAKIIERCRANGILVHWGSEIQYVKTRDRSYLPIGVNDSLSIDYAYYLQRVADVVSRLLTVSHGYDRKAVLTYLKGGKILC